MIWGSRPPTLSLAGSLSGLGGQDEATWQPQPPETPAGVVPAAQSLLCPLTQLLPGPVTCSALSSGHRVSSVVAHTAHCPLLGTPPPGLEELVPAREKPRQLLQHLLSLPLNQSCHLHGPHPRSCLLGRPQVGSSVRPSG